MQLLWPEFGGSGCAAWWLPQPHALGCGLLHENRGRSAQAHEGCELLCANRGRVARAHEGCRLLRENRG
eukprot:1079332-Pelagomonas_calceolata.AAC.1